MLFSDRQRSGVAQHSQALTERKLTPFGDDDKQQGQKQGLAECVSRLACTASLRAGFTAHNGL